MDFRHRLWRLFHSSARNDRSKQRRRMFLESLESRQLLASLLQDDLAAFQTGDKAEPGDPLSKVGYDLASTYAYFQGNGTAPPETSNSNVSLMRFNSNRTQVLIEASSVADNPSSLETKLQGLGFVETGEFGRMLSGWLPINQIDTLSALPELKIANASYDPLLATGTVNSEGDEAMRADVARATSGVTGAGVKVGVISDSFNSLGGFASDVISGNLPSNVQILQDTTGTDEGRAMAQIVHDVAPGSSLAYATGTLGQANFASNIIALADAGSQVIVDDIGYLSEPFFQNGVISQAVNTVAGRGVSFFSAAGNSGRQGYKDTFRSGSAFTNGQIPSAAGATPFFGGVAHDFDPGATVNNFQSFTLASGGGVILGLQWDQPFGSLGGPGSANDVDFYVLDAAGAQVLGGSAVGNTGGDPNEIFAFQNTTATAQTYNLMIVRFAGAAPGLMNYINFVGNMGNVAFATNTGTAWGHPNATGAVAVGAAWFQQTPEFGTNPPVLETFSSPGGIPILFADNGTRLATPVDLRKVDFVAPDGVSTSLAGFNPFFGTSAAAPHAAAVAALMKQANPAATATQIRNAMASTAIPMANPFSPSYNYAAGAGLIQADAAVNAIRPFQGSGTGRIAGTKFNDLDGDGVFDIDEDLDRDGVLDPSEDRDGDGVLDLGEDRDGDGVLDPAEDLDNDNVIDTEDTDGDGFLDPGEDRDGDGQIDTEDVNGNGVLDPREDTDGDGVLDLTEDLDGDGVLDPSEDVDGDGKLDRREPGIQGVTIYVDISGDGKISVLEPAGVTDFFGNYLIKDVPAGSNHILREVTSGGVQTLPGPLGLPVPPAVGSLPFAYTSVIVLPNQTTFNMHFGNDTRTANDFGDAPATYGSASHRVVAGVRLGTLQDGEGFSQSNATATGDDISNLDDEDGVIIGNLTPGQGFNGVPQATITVTVGNVANLTARLQGWIDFDQSGTFEASEKVISNRTLGAGTHAIGISIPSNARLNPTFARFRYAFEADVGPTGHSTAGEVEDYQVTILPPFPQANDDEFGLPPDLIRQGTIDNELDVLANDQLGASGPPLIVESDFPKTTAEGGTVRVGPVDPATGRKVLLYTPPSSAIIQAPFDDTFTYRVSSNGTALVPTDSATVLIHVALADPIAVDDTFTLDPPGSGATLATLSVLANDLFPVLDTQVQSVVNITAAAQTTMTINAGDPTKVDFSAPEGFRGTEVFQYTITDSDPSTGDSTAFITVQVVEGGIGVTTAELANDYLAQLSIRLLDTSLNPITEIGVGETFVIQVRSLDLRPGGTADTRGVEAAYLDLLIPYLVTPEGAKLPYATPVSIEYNPRYADANHENLNFPAQGQIDEAGGFHGFGPGVPPGLEFPVFNVTMLARQSTVGEPGGVIQFRGDSPDGFEENREISDILVRSEDEIDLDPIVAFHELNNPPASPQVLDTFFRPSADFRIIGPEGEFVNLSNPLDVDLDNEVTASDALLVINSLNANGPMSLDGVSGMGKVDCDRDNYLTASDALSVINYINSRRSIVWVPTSSSGGSDTSSAGDTSGTDMSGGDSSSSTSTSTVDPASADELYAQEAARETLRNKFKRR